MKKTEAHALIPVETIARQIYLLRRRRVMLDSDLARLYGVQTKALNRAVRRNLERFPPDFMFHLSRDEARNLRFQFGASSWGGRRYLPYVFTQEGVAMLSSVLRSKRAVQVNIAIMRAFVQFRELLATHRNLAQKLDALERKHAQHDVQIQAIFAAIRKLLQPTRSRRRPIGFAPPDAPG